MSKKVTVIVKPLTRRVCKGFLICKELIREELTLKRVRVPFCLFGFDINVAADVTMGYIPFLLSVHLDPVCDWEDKFKSVYGKIVAK